MSTPVVELIAQALATQLETITVANGYEVTVSTVHRPVRLGLPTALEAYDIVVQQDDPTLDEELEDGVNGILQWIQPFLVQCFVRPSETSSDPVDGVVNVFRSDIEKAMLGSESWWVSGIVGTAVPNFENIITPDGQYEGGQSTLAVKYRVDRTDPYTAR